MSWRHGIIASSLVARFIRTDGSFGPAAFAAIAPLASLSLGIRPNPKSLRDFLVHRFKRIDVLGTFNVLHHEVLVSHSELGRKDHWEIARLIALRPFGFAALLRECNSMQCKRVNQRFPSLDFWSNLE